MLCAESLSFRYRQDPWVLENIDLSLKSGEIVGLPGPSGRGKTTLGKLLCGYLAPVAGTVRIDGKPLPDKAYCPAQLLFQHPELAMNPRRRIGEILAEAYFCEEDIRQIIGIRSSWLERYPHELSGGELQRIALARVMNDSTRYLVADEMTAMLDANTQALIWNTMLCWAKRRNVGILAISHDRHLLERVADRIDDRFSDESGKTRSTLLPC